MHDFELLRRLGRAFIWLGLPACAVQLLLALPSAGSFTGFLLIVSDTIAKLASTVGLGAVLLALALIAQSLDRRDRAPRTAEEQES